MLTALVASLVVAAPVAQAGSSSTDDVPALLMEWTEGGEGARYELTALGPEITPILLELLTGERSLTAPGTPPPVDGGTLRRLAADLCGTWQEEAVLRELDGYLEGANTLDQRLAAARLIGGFGGAQSLEFLVEWMRDASAVELGHPRIASVITGATGAILEREPHAARTLSRLVDTLPTALLPSLARAAAQSPSTWGYELVSEMFGRSVALDRVLLDVLGGWPRWRPEGSGGETEQRVLEYLTSEEPLMRRSAITVLGQQEAIHCAPLLIDGLLDSDRLVRAASHKALIAVSGQGLGADAASWSAWLRGEEEWAQAHGDAQRAALQGESRAAIVRALNELALHRFARQDSIGSVLELLEHYDPAVVVTACSTLARLGAPEAVPALIQCAQLDHPRIAATASAALADLTGYSAPRNPSGWSARLGL